jgi:MFS transporter, DHA1 family, multidrug resistance protein
VLAVVAILNLAVLFWCLPEGHQPDPKVSLHPVPIIKNFIEVLKEKQFLTFALSGAFAFSGLLVYVAGSPIIFMEVFKVDARTFGMIFAGLAVGFIGSNQINVMLLKWFSSEQIFRASLFIVCPVALLFLVGTHLGWFGLPSTLVLIFIALSSLGLAFPNAAALALVPFDHNIGSASAMLGLLQIGVSGLASASIGLFDSHDMLPVTVILAATSWIGLGIYFYGRSKIPALHFVEEKDAEPLGH